MKQPSLPAQDMRMTATDEELRRGMEPVPFKRADKRQISAHFAEGWPDHIRTKIEAGVGAQIHKLMADAHNGEELWICRSRYLGPFAEHEGFGLVRKGVEVGRYERVRNY